MVRAPKAFSIVVVMEKALPSSSTMEMWLVPLFSTERSLPKAPCFTFGGDPAATVARARSGSIKARRPAR